MSNLQKAIVDEINKIIISLKENKSNIIIAIDGPCAGGKTTLASMLKERVDADVLHMDDFFLPLYMRTKERYNTPGGNVHYERFLEEVLMPISKNIEYNYRPFDCKTMSFKEEKVKKPSVVTVVEGSYSLHPELAKYYDLKIFVDVDIETQLQRILKRNGQDKLKDFKDKWIVLENLYFDAFHIKSIADIVIE